MNEIYLLAFNQRNCCERRKFSEIDSDQVNSLLLNGEQVNFNTTLVHACLKVLTLDDHERAVDLVAHRVGYRRAVDALALVIYVRRLVHHF